MLKKLVVVLIAALFSLSVSGLTFAAEEKKPATPAAPAKKEGATNPCATGEKVIKKKAKKTAKKTAKKKEEAKEGATPATPATPAKPAEKK